MMKKALVLLVTATAAVTAFATAASAYEAEWKRGRIYYRSVCTSCHAAEPIGSIAPSTRTKAEWAEYLKADSHAKGKDKVSRFLSKAYRAEIKASNKAAEKFADVADEDLTADVAAFLMRGAKDGDEPASCN
jgi:cytochrome c5